MKVQRVRSIADATDKKLWRKQMVSFPFDEHTVNLQGIPTTETGVLMSNHTWKTEINWQRTRRDNFPCHLKGEYQDLLLLNISVWCNKKMRNKFYLLHLSVQVPFVEGCQWPIEPAAHHQPCGSSDSITTPQSLTESWPSATDGLNSVHKFINITVRKKHVLEKWLIELGVKKKRGGHRVVMTRGIHMMAVETIGITSSRQHRSETMISMTRIRQLWKTTWLWGGWIRWELEQRAIPRQSWWTFCSKWVVGLNFQHTRLPGATGTNSSSLLLLSASACRHLLLSPVVLLTRFFVLTDVWKNTEKNIIPFFLFN